MAARRALRLGLLAALLPACEAANVVADPAPDVDAGAAAWVRLRSPAAGDVVESGFIVAIEAAAPARVQIAGRPDQVVSPGPDGVARLPVAAPPGPLEVRVAPADGAGEGAQVRVFVARATTLHPPPAAGTVTLRLDREALGALLSPAEQARVPLVDLDLGPLVQGALVALLDPERAGVDRSDWGPAEENLVRLLGNTPASTDPTGTALGPVLALGERLGLPPGRILADLLGIAPDEAILGADVLAEVLLDDLIGTHPVQAAQADPRRLRVTLADALADLAPLAERFGPAGAHPGFLAGPPTAELFTPAFAMVVEGTGQARRLPGVDRAGAYATHLELPADGEVLALDFEDPARFRVEGLAPIPRAGLTLGLTELPRFVPLPAPDPAPRGQSEAWAAEPWTLEHIVVDAAWRAYGTRFPGERLFAYALGALDPATEIAWLDGRVTVHTVAGLGPPPPPAYVWDLILDVAQVRLHDGVEEGGAAIRLRLPPLAIGLDADGLIAAMRPALQARRADLVRMMLGDPADLPSEAVAWVEGGKLRFSSDFEVFRDAAETDGPLADVPAGVPTTLFARDADGRPASLTLVPGEPARLLWAPR